MHQRTRMSILVLALGALVFAGSSCEPPQPEKTPPEASETSVETPATTPAVTSREEVSPERFVGTWYGDLVFADKHALKVKIDLAMEGDVLTGSVTLFTDGFAAVAFETRSVVLRDGKLYLQTASGLDGPEGFEIELHVPKDELLGRLVGKPGQVSNQLVLSKDAPELAKYFAEGLVHSVDEVRAARARARCQNNLKQLGLVFKMYASENRGAWPALQDRPGRLMFRVEPVYPEYLTDLMVVVCPAAGEAPPDNMDVREKVAWFCDDRSFWYLGYALKDEAQGLAFVEAYRRRAVTGEGFDEDLEEDQGNTIHRLREGVERFFVTDINVPGPGQGKIPAVIERPGNHEDGASVLFMDGHVEFHRYPGAWPMTERFIQALQSLDELEH